MKSWAVPKGPSFDPKDKRMAVHVEDHPISYNSFEGTIPEKQYGAGKVIIWDKGTWMPLEDPHEGYRAGKLKFELHGHKLRGHWALVRMKQPRREAGRLAADQGAGRLRPAGGRVQRGGRAARQRGAPEALRPAAARLPPRGGKPPAAKPRRRRQTAPASAGSGAVPCPRARSRPRCPPR